MNRRRTIAFAQEVIGNRRNRFELRAFKVLHETKLDGIVGELDNIREPRPSRQVVHELDRMDVYARISRRCSRKRAFQRREPRQRFVS